uniref:Sphingomyelin synthase-like domain-containing protein n=2 Tax=Latimeria chalumnae TaxID=7897 RepID=H3BCB4_LATCH
IKIIVTSGGDKYPSEWWKTLAMLVYAILAFLVTSIGVVIVNNWVPAKELAPPLPDLFFRYIGHYDWAFKICELNAWILFMLWTIQWLFLRHKSIVGRRYLFILGTLCVYRSLTMIVTVLPIPGNHLNCEPKASGDYMALLKQSLKLRSGGRMLANGSRTLCSDYVYSGHAATMILTYLFIQTYSPRKFWLYQWACCFLCVTGVLLILLAHNHYTLDVIVAYFVTTRLFWMYHTLANNKTLKTHSAQNPQSQVWWFGIFQFCEENVMGTLPQSFSWPIS